ncbi:hypothetical protein [Streptomyces sp. NPDC002851]
MHPQSNSGEWAYLVPHWKARTDVAARAEAKEQHTKNIARMTDPRWVQGMVISEVTFRPAVRSWTRAVAWIALQQCGAITENGWPLAAERGERIRDECWRVQVGELHQGLRARVHGFASTLEEIARSPVGTSAACAVEPHTDRFGRVWWDQVRQEINKAGLSRVWQTPYGVCWIDQG